MYKDNYIRTSEYSKMLVHKSIKAGIVLFRNFYTNTHIYFLSL